MEGLLQPKSLNSQFLTTILQSVETNSPDIEVLEWRCNHAAPAGTNYMSLVYRISVRYQVHHGHDNSSKNIILKTPLQSGSVKAFMEKANGYENEVKMYKEVIPAMYKLHNYDLTARSFDCPLHNSLALEDLTEQEYKMVDRLKQLDPAHCRLSLIALARFHAASVALRHTCPQLVEYFKKDMVSDYKNKHEFLNFSLGALLRTVEDLKVCKKYAEAIRDKIDNFTERMCNINKHTYGLEVLCHGDGWTNNILFKYDNLGEAVDSKLLDFQMVYTSSFAIDIYKFWWSSANEDTRENHKENMFEIYRMTLNQTLMEQGSNECLSKKDFDMIMKFYAPFSLEIISGFLTIAMADPENLGDFNKFIEGPAIKPNEDSLEIKNYNSKYYRAILPNILRQADECGVFS